VDWDRFVAAVPSCASQNNSASIRCLQQANLSAEALQNATAAAGRSNTNQFPFIPTFDGTTGVYPTPGSIVLKSGNWSKIPFITGCNKDEGTAFIPFPQFLTNDASQVWVKSNFTPPLVPFVGYKMLNASTSRIAQLYPNDPAAGAPFGTGNETFGFNPEFKRLAALSTRIVYFSLSS
jgi:acetylcholinesterase